MKVYHGTATQYAIEIAESGALLSPLQKQIESFEKDTISDWALERYGSIERVAEHIVLSAYPERQFRFRGKCVSVATSLDRARGYATQHDGGVSSGGVVLALEVPDTIMDTALKSWNEEILFVPERIPLEHLTELYLTERAHDFYWDRINEAFAAYEPTYYLL
jgi:hypothetical protein